MGSQTHIHRFQIDRHNVGTCKCGEVRQFPWNAQDPAIVLKKGNPQVSEKEGLMKQHHMHKHKYYEDHREEIVADLRSIGRRPTCIKWNIPSSTMAQLEKRWLTLQERQEFTSRSYAHKGPQTVRKVVISNGNDNLPSFPEFSNEWAESVQFKWFEIYEKLIGIP